MWRKSLPRTVNSLRRSSPVATPGSDLDRAQRIVGEHAAQILKLGAAEHLLRRDDRLGRAEHVPAPP